MTAVYDFIAPHYDETRTLPPDVSMQITDAIIALSSLPRDACILELGIGTGRIALPFIRRGYRYTGVDASASMLDVLRRKLQTGETVTIHQADASTLEFLVDDQFDLALASCALHYLKDIHRALDEIVCVLKRDRGVFVHCRNEMPPHQQAFDQLWQMTLSKYDDSFAVSTDYSMKDSLIISALRQRANIVEQQLASSWHVEHTVGLLYEAYARRSYPSCWRVSDDLFQKALADLASSCERDYGGFDVILDSMTRFDLIVASDWKPLSG